MATNSIEVDSSITTKEGLLFKNDKLLSTHEADEVARSYGFIYAERLIKYLEEQKNED